MRAARCTAAAIALLVALGPARAAAAPPVDDVAPPSVEAPDPALAEAKQLYDEGLAEYETFEYDGAISKWTQAYGKLGASPDTAEMRNAIVYNIARAREQAYEQTRDLGHLRKAKALLERYVAEEIAAGSPDEHDLATARARVEELGDRIAEIERTSATPKPTATPASTATDDRERPRGPGRTLIIVGGVLAGVGVGLAIGGVTAGAVLGKRADRDVPGLDELGDEQRREDRIADGRRANVLMLACGIAGGAVALTGIVLVAVGAVKQRRAPRTAVAPALGPGYAGLALRARF